MNPNHIPHYVGLRTAIDEFDLEEKHLECRFPDGTKGPAVIVDGDCEDLAVLLTAFLNDKQLVALVRDRQAANPLYMNGLVPAQGGEDFAHIPIMDRPGEGCTARVACQQSTQQGRLVLPEPAIRAVTYGDDGELTAFQFADGSELDARLGGRYGPSFAWCAQP